MGVLSLYLFCYAFLYVDSSFAIILKRKRKLVALFYYALLYVHSSFAIILKRKRKLVVLLLLPYRCIVIINVLWLFLTVGLQCVIVVFPDHTLLHI